jgi:hypothetical protein
LLKIRIKQVRFFLKILPWIKEKILCTWIFYSSAVNLKNTFSFFLLKFNLLLHNYFFNEI